MLKKRLIILGALLVGATAGYALWSKTSDVEKWRSLSVKRERSMVSRHLNSFQRFLRGQIKSELSTVFGLRMSGHKENVVYAFGRIISEKKAVGTISPRFYYHGWADEPTSVAYDLVLEPSFIKGLPENEFNRLIRQTRLDHPVTGKIGDISLFSQIEKDGRVKVDLRAPYPTRWVEDIPEYDRGYRDTFYFEDFNRALRYLRRNVLADEHTPIWLDLPVMNPPEERGGHDVGIASGYFELKGGRLVGFEFGTSSTTKWPKERSFTIYISGGSSQSPSESTTKITEEESRALIRTDLLSKGRNTSESGIVIQSNDTLIFPIQISGHLEALDKYRSKL